MNKFLATSQKSFRLIRSLRTISSYDAPYQSRAASITTSPGDNPFSIQGKFRDGRASYLDMSATTPLDPRVLDKMMSYFVSGTRYSFRLSD